MRFTTASLLHGSRMYGGCEEGVEPRLDMQGHINGPPSLLWSKAAAVCVIDEDAKLQRLRQIITMQYFSSYACWSPLAHKTCLRPVYF